MRVIDDKTFAEIIKMLLEDQKVQLFQKLVTAPTAEPEEKYPADAWIRNPDRSIAARHRRS